jgi:two-component system, OmpR family, response regulator
MMHTPQSQFIRDWQNDSVGSSPAHPTIPSHAEHRAWHVLVIDDDPALRDMISDYLTAHDIRVSTAADSQQMAQALAEAEVDLAVLDLKLGPENGFEIVRSLRASSDLPIIVVTGRHRDEVDRIVGLELGADDYLTKPFSPRELLARIRAVLRRSERRLQWPEQERQDGKPVRYRFAGWELSLRRRRLTSPAGEVVPLTNGEFTLLAAFVQAPQRVLTREYLLTTTRVHDNEVFDRSIDVQVLRLRRKIEENPTAPELIMTERGVGYVFTPAAEIV